MEMEILTSVVESILFISERPVGPERVLEVLGLENSNVDEIAQAFQLIQQRYQNDSHGFELREAQGGFTFCTKVRNAEAVRKFLQTKPFRLGRSALETLAIIAYRQPVTRSEIDKVRGIDSSHLLRTLVERGMVRMAGKAEVPGRPVQYGTTPRFLEVVGLKSLAELPPLTELDQLQGHTEVASNPLEDGLDKFMQDKSSADTVLHEDETELAGIDTLIQQVQKADREIYESPIHAEVAAENQTALEGFLAFFKPLRKPRASAAAAAVEAEADAPVVEIDLSELAVPETSPLESVTEFPPDVNLSAADEPPPAN